MRRRVPPLALVLAVSAAAVFHFTRTGAPSAARAVAGVGVAAERASGFGEGLVDRLAEDHGPSALSGDGASERPLTLPTGAPTAITCDEARIVVAQARGSLALPPTPIDAAKFADATSDWLDPHGLWSVAPDAPVGRVVRKHAERLLAELQAPPGSGPCTAATEVAARLRTWSDELRAVFRDGEERGRAQAAATTAAQRLLDDGFKVASSTPFEDGTVTHSARDLARELGRQVGLARAAFGPGMDPFVAAAETRAAPQLSDDAWTKIVVAAALRAYVPQLDAHGAWAPLDEEISIYDLSLEAEPPERIWTEMTRTALGVRIDHGALGPLVDGDVVLRIDDVPLAGISVEQAEQLSAVEAAHPGVATRVTVLRSHGKEPIVVSIEPPRADSSDEDAPAPQASASSGSPELQHELVRYGDGRALVVPIHDVPDDLGPRLENTLASVRKMRDLRGVVLDLRANGGGSTDGAIAALSLFLPGAALFPMKRRDGGVEVERAPDLGPDRVWKGAVGVLVDGDSASAAEMIAGAIAAYRRGVVVGDRTYGKGCAQEYLDDDAHTGVLRLTTLLYALPDGSPVQKTGIAPMVQLNLPPVAEHEASLARSLDAWRGPDVRDRDRMKEVPWPSHSGHVGPCSDPVLCRALRALGASSAAKR